VELAQRDGAPGPDEAVLQHELQRSLSAAIDALPPPQRAALVLHYYLELDEAAVARILECPVGTVKWRLYAARRRLRRHLGPELEISAS
jgi:RNA polymerase sigma-70 factor (ECF subfamily)